MTHIKKRADRSRGSILGLMVLVLAATFAVGACGDPDRPLWEKPRAYDGPK